jgi:Glycosyl transferase family 2
VLISVITPTLNGMQYLGDCIEWIRIQQRTDVEVEHIVVDGGSSDETVEFAPVTGLPRDDRQGRRDLRRHKQRFVRRQRRRPTAVALGGTELVRSLALAGIRYTAVVPARDANRFSPVLFYQSDEELLFVSRHRGQLSRCFGFVLAEAELVDKARALSLPMPATAVVASGSLQPPEAPFEPCHAMPSTCGPGGWRAPGDERAAS